MIFLFFLVIGVGLLGALIGVAIGKFTTFLYEVITDWKSEYEWMKENPKCKTCDYYPPIGVSAVCVACKRDEINTEGKNN